MCINSIIIDPRVAMADGLNCRDRFANHYSYHRGVDAEEEGEEVIDIDRRIEMSI